MEYEVLKTRHIREIFIPMRNKDYRYLKFSKNICLVDTVVNYSYYKDRVINEIFKLYVNKIYTNKYHR
jgi:hypothetical protein